MPLYEYECRKCHHRFEEIEKSSTPHARKCPKCKKGTADRLPSAPAVHFKGTGWYVTDYGRKNAAPGASDKEGKEGAKETVTKDEKGSKESAKESAADTGAKKDSGKKGSKKD